MRVMLTLLALSLATTPLGAAELAVGSPAPGFTLTNAVDGKAVTFAPAGGRPSVVIFTCNSCPFSRAFEGRIVELGRKYGAKGVAFYAVNPNDDQAYPAEAADKMRERAAERGFPFPYLKDTGSATARAYGARVTPHVYVVDQKGIVRYRGYVDDSAKPEERAHAGLSDALDALLAGKPPASAETRAFGCTIKFAPAR